MSKLFVGGKFRGKRILDMVRLSNGWIILKTEDRKSARDFRVRTIYRTQPRIRSYTPKHAHFAIDFFGKLCADRDRAMRVFQAIIDVWSGRSVSETLSRYEDEAEGLPGYSLEYILHALNWILEQEDVNFRGRPPDRQRELDDVLNSLNIATPLGREGSQLALSLFCNIALGQHPVDAFIRANLDVLPVKRARGRL
jgi:hypothetical protein